MSDGVGVVAAETMKLELPSGELRLKSGGVLKEIQVRYETCGAPRKDDNVVFVCHALTGDAHVAGMRPGETKASGWWEELVGPGRGIDTNRFHVICANVLGGCSGTTGPSSINPDTGKPYGSGFPQYSIDDTVDVYRMLLKQLGVRRLALVIGGSYGGLQVVSWMTRYPEEVMRAGLIATSARLNTQAIAYGVIGRSLITSDPAWLGGDYYQTGDGRGPIKGLAAARQIAHITYLSQELLERKFARNLQVNYVEASPAARAERERNFKTYFQVESYLDHQGEKFINRFDANSYLHITRSMDLFDPAERYGSLSAAFSRVMAKTLVCSYAKDVLFTREQSEEIAAELRKAGKSVTVHHFNGGLGHDSFLTDVPPLAQVLTEFLKETI